MTQAARDLLLTELRRRLSRAVVRVCPAWLSSHAEDIVQTALLRVLGAARVRGEGDPDLSSSYLEKAAYSATVDEIRRHRRRREEAAPMERPVREAAADQADPETLAASREIAAGVGHCLSRLALPRRLAVTLHLQGHAVSEIAALLGWRFKKAENLVYRGLADLRRCLAARGLAR